jgi:hypothetical protein
MHGIAQSRLRAVHGIARSRLRAMRHSGESIFIIEYLREYEFKFETALTHKSGIPGVLIDLKTLSSKIS